MAEIGIHPHKCSAQKIDQIAVIGTDLTFNVRKQIAGYAGGETPLGRLYEIAATSRSLTSQSISPPDMTVFPFTAIVE